MTKAIVLKSFLYPFCYLISVAEIFYLQKRLMAEASSMRLKMKASEKFSQAPLPIVLTIIIPKKEYQKT